MDERGVERSRPREAGKGGWENKDRPEARKSSRRKRERFSSRGWRGAE